MTSTLAARVRDVGFHPNAPSSYTHPPIPSSQLQLQLQRQSSITNGDGFAVHKEEEESKYSPHPSPAPSHSHRPSLPHPHRQRSAPSTFTSVPHALTSPLDLSSLLRATPLERSSSLFTPPPHPPLGRTSSSHSLHEGAALRLGGSSLGGSFDLMRSISGLSRTPPDDPPASPFDPLQSPTSSDGWYEGVGEDEEEVDPLKAFRAKMRAAFDENSRRMEVGMKSMEAAITSRLIREVDDRHQRLLSSLHPRSLMSPYKEKKEEERLSLSVQPLHEDLDQLKEQFRLLKKRTVQLSVREETRERRLEEVERSLAFTSTQKAGEKGEDFTAVTQLVRAQAESVERLERQLAQVMQRGTSTHPLHSPVVMATSANGVWPAGLGLPDGGASGLMVSQGVLAPVTLHSLSCRLGRVEHELSSHTRAFQESVAFLQSTLSSQSSSASALLHSSLQPIKASLKQFQSQVDDLSPLQRRLLLIEEENRRMRLRQEEDWAAVKGSLDRMREEWDSRLRREEAIAATARDSQADGVAVGRQQRQWGKEDRQERLREEKRDKEEKSRQWREDRTTQQREAAALVDELRHAAQKAVKEEVTVMERRVKEAVKDHWAAEKEDRGWGELKAQVERAERRSLEEGEAIRQVYREVREVREEVHRMRRYTDSALQDMRATVKAVPSIPTPAPMASSPQTFYIHAPTPVTVATPSPAPSTALVAASASPPPPTTAGDVVLAAVGVSPPSSPVAPLQPTAFARPLGVPNVLSHSAMSSLSVPQLEMDPAAARRLEMAVLRLAVEEKAEEQVREREREKQREAERCRVQEVERLRAEVALRAAEAVRQKREEEEQRRRQEEVDRAYLERAAAEAASEEARKREEEAREVQRELQAAQARQAAAAAALVAAAAKRDQEEALRRQEAATKAANSKSQPLQRKDEAPSTGASSPSSLPPLQVTAATSPAESPQSVSSSPFPWSLTDSAELSVLARNLPVVSRQERRTSLIVRLSPPPSPPSLSTPPFHFLDITDPSKIHTCGPYDVERTFLLSSPSTWKGGDGSRCRLSVYEKREGGGGSEEEMVGSCWLQLDEMWKRKGGFFTLALTAESRWKGEQLHTKRSSVMCNLTQPNALSMKVARDREAGGAASAANVAVVEVGSGGLSRSVGGAEKSTVSSPLSRSQVRSSPSATPPRAVSVLPSPQEPRASVSLPSRSREERGKTSTVGSASSSGSQSEDEMEVIRSSSSSITVATARSTVTQSAPAPLPAVTQRPHFSYQPTASSSPPQSNVMSSSTILSSMQMHSTVNAGRRPAPASDDSSSDDDDGAATEAVVRRAATESVVRRHANEVAPPTRMALAAAAANKPPANSAPVTPPHPTPTTTTHPPVPSPAALSAAALNCEKTVNAPPPTRPTFTPSALPSPSASYVPFPPSHGSINARTPSASSSTSTSAPRPPATVSSSTLPLRASLAPVSRSFALAVSDGDEDEDRLSIDACGEEGVDEVELSLSDEEEVF